MVTDFWRRAFKRAASDAFAKVGLTSLGGALVTATLVLASAALVGWWNNMRFDEPLTDAVATLLVPIVIAALLFIPLLARACAALEHDAYSALAAFQIRFSGRIEVGVRGPSNVQLMALTSETGGGERLTSYLSSADLICLTCQNHSDVELTNCRARIMSAERIERTGTRQDLSLIEAIDLPWGRPTLSGDDFETSLKASLAPNETKRVWIASVRGRGQVYLCRDPKTLPADYQRLLGLAGTYRLVIQINGDNLAPQRFHVEIVSSPGDPPVPNSMQVGRAEIRLLPPPPAVDQRVMQLSN